MKNLIALVVFCIPILLVIAPVEWYLFFVLGTAGIPLSMLATQRALLLVFEGMGLNAIKLFGCMFGGFFIVSARPKKAISQIWIWGPHAFFILFCFLSILWCPNFIFGFRTIAKLLAPLIFLLVILVGVNNVSQLKLLESAVFLSCLTLFALAVSNYIFGYIDDPSTAGFRNSSMLTAPFVSPAPFSFHLACGALLALCNFIIIRKKIYLFLFLVLSFSVFWAFTRISMAGLVIASSVCIFMLVKSISFRILVPITICVLFAFSIFANERLLSRTFKNTKNISVSTIFKNPGEIKKQLHTSGRSRAWSLAIKKFFKINPLVGSGIGATQTWFYGSGRKHLGVIHSEYLRLLCEVGILGLFLYLFAMATYIAKTIKIYLRLSSQNNKSSILTKKYAALSTSALVFYLITMATDNSFDYVMYLGLYVFSFLAIPIAIEANKLLRDK